MKFFLWKKFFLVDAQWLLLLFAGGGGQVFIANSLFGPKLSNNGDEMAETKLERESNKFLKKRCISWIVFFGKGRLISDFCSSVIILNPYP